MPLDTIYLTRHGHRLNWTIDYKTGTYTSQFPTPTGNPADPTLTSHGVRQAQELAAHILSENVHPKPFRIYSSPFYRCIQTIAPTVEALKQSTTTTTTTTSSLDPNAEYNIRIENGLGEWFGLTTFFHHPTPPTHSTLQTLPTFSALLNPTRKTPALYTSTRGETIPQLHNRIATTLSCIIAEVDAEIAALEAAIPAEQRKSKALLICSHAAPLIAMGRVLTGVMPEDSAEEDFLVYTAGLSVFRRRRGGEGEGGSGGWKMKMDGGFGLLADGTRVTKVGEAFVVPKWEGGNGVGGGWDCVVNGDCSFLSGGAERGWHFSGEESFDTGPMATEAEVLGSSGSGSEKLETKL